MTLSLSLRTLLNLSSYTLSWFKKKKNNKTKTNKKTGRPHGHFPVHFPPHPMPTLHPPWFRASHENKLLMRFLIRAGPSLLSSSHWEQGVDFVTGPHNPSSPKSCSRILAQATAALMLLLFRLWEAEKQHHT